MSRKMEVRAELGPEPRHSDMKCQYPKGLLNHCLKGLPASLCQDTGQGSRCSPFRWTSCPHVSHYNTFDWSLAARVRGGYVDKEKRNTSKWKKRLRKIHLKLVFKEMSLI